MLKGKGVSKGIGIGHTKVLKNEEVKLTDFKVEDKENELNYFKLSFVKYILNNASYVKYSLKGNKKNLDIYYEAINKRWTFIIAHLLGILLYIKDRKK